MIPLNGAIYREIEKLSGSEIFVGIYICDSMNGIKAERELQKTLGLRREPKNRQEALLKLCKLHQNRGFLGLLRSDDCITTTPLSLFLFVTLIDMMVWGAY